MLQGLINWLAGKCDLSAGAHKTTLSTALSSSLDSIDVGKMSNGGATTALNAITATTTSAEIEVGAKGYKHIMLEFTGSGMTSGYAITLTGSAITGGTFGAIYKQKDDGTFVATSSITFATNGVLNYVIPFVAVNYLKITGTKTDGTLTVKVIPFN